ncbi:MAG: sigma-54-dependent Fis family transcriptional regulator [Bacteroidetes bacterium QS_7_67_15]|nr:MAG: sigma-54-dependent Fis family transcriptional regulator [Bacteroidetes bacterium QS_7_67_15]
MDRASFQERFGIHGSSAALRGVIDRVRRVADTDITVLLQGDGAEKGAYTGATQQRAGYFEEADGSTIFLDEIGEMPQAAQVRLLRVLESGRFSRVGSAEQRQADVRVVAATNKDLADEVAQGRFREDLYYRLSTVLIDVPPLRERSEDVVPLFERFLHAFSAEHGATGKRLTEEAEELLERYRWPGNVRELKNVAEQSVVLLREQEITAEALRPFLRGVSKSGATGKLMRVEHRRRGPSGEEAGAGERSGPAHSGRERELLYRAVLEMRMDLREVKDRMQTLAENIGVAVPRALVERGDFPPSDEDDYVVMPSQAARREQSSSSSEGARDYDSIIEDVVYEIEDDEGRGDGGAPPPAPDDALDALEEHTAAAPPERSAPSERAEAPTALDEAPQQEDAPDEQALPTLEEAEEDLIRQALRRFEGNRRRTARALGISERTLYRKLKDIDEDL